MTSYWFSDFCALFNSFSINPLGGTDKNLQYNSLTRLIIVCTLIAAIVYPRDHLMILASGGFSLLLSVCVYFLTLNSPGGVESRTISDRQPTEYSNGIYSGGLTDLGKDILDNYDTNTKNQLLINRPALNTQKLKHMYILDGNKSPNNVIKETIVPDTNNLFAQQVMTGTVKQLNSLQNKNISPV